MMVDTIKVTTISVKSELGFLKKLFDAFCTCKPER